MRPLLNEEDWPNWARPLQGCSFLSCLSFYRGKVIFVIVSTNPFLGPNDYLCFKYIKLMSIKEIYDMKLIMERIPHWNSYDGAPFWFLLTNT